MRGFSALGFVNQKDSKNAGALLRAAHAYDVGLVVFDTPHDAVRDCLNTSRAERHIPVIFGDVRKMVPYGARKVAIEYIKSSRPLTTYQHPDQAFYVFGPEGSSLSDEIISWADDVVYVPTTICMNLACAANVVLYDRLLKSGTV